MSRRLGLTVFAFAWLTLAASGQAQAPPETAGDAARGQALFASKHCERCHAPRGKENLGPALEELRKPQGALELTGRLWNHAPVMFATLKEERLAWPSISPAEMADLMAYLQAEPVRDPVADLARGQVTMLRKGCLKCHSLRREGGGIGPDLSARRGDYESAAAWAATMWAHTPRMATMTRERGILYPRFTGDEMVNLVGFLRGVAAASPKP